MNRFILMLQFFTRLPINKQVSVEMEDFRYGSIYLPLVGLIIGAINASSYALASYTGNRLFAAVIAILADAIVTGALHLDGLSDTCDGLFSSRSRDKILEIMKDSRIGAMGALSLIFFVLIKVSLLYELSFAGAVYSLIIIPIISRTSVLYGIAIAKYPKETGLGKTFVGNVTMKEFIIGLAICLLIITPLLKISTLVFIILVFLGPQLFNRYIESKIGGMTGDTLGALNEVQSVLCLIVLCILSGYLWR